MWSAEACLHMHGSSSVNQTFWAGICYMLKLRTGYVQDFQPLTGHLGYRGDEAALCPLEIADPIYAVLLPEQQEISAGRIPNLILCLSGCMLLSNHKYS